MKLAWLILCSLLFSQVVHGQCGGNGNPPVVVSEYYNEASASSEWTELVVVTDNTDLRSWKVGDNNSSTTSWQGKREFLSTQTAWQNVRGGMIIIIYHGTTSSTDTDFSDGDVAIGETDVTYITCGSGSVFDVAGGGDFIQLVDDNDNHIHAIGHDASPGTSVTGAANASAACWGNCSTTCSATTPDQPWSFRNSALSSAQNLFVVGAYPDSYCAGNGAPTTDLNEASTNAFQGLANNATVEADWRDWREPDFASQTVSGTDCSAGVPGFCASFTWTACTDPVPADGTQGYLILSNSTNTFGTPVDGTVYTVGTTPFGAGNGYVVANLDNTTTTPGTMNYTDNPGQNGTAFYRIYAYRYSGSGGGELELGRAYETSNFVTVDLMTFVLPVDITNFAGEQDQEVVNLTWRTATELNNDYFTLKRSTDGANWTPIGVVDGAGDSNTPLNYQFVDRKPHEGINYYKLEQTDLDGTVHDDLQPVAVEFDPKAGFALVQVIPAPDQLYLSVSNPDNELYRTEIYDANGRLIDSDMMSEGIVYMNTSMMPNGIYFLRVSTESKVFTKKFVIQR